jgi:tRNA threonylcarbamoyl adenosine modification protein YeaZ
MSHPITPATHDGRRRAILAIDTSTTRIVVASGDAAGHPDGLTTWVAGQRHGETLLPALGRFLGEQNIRRSRISAIVVGTGPGAFTGLRVGIATAKGLAHGLGIPIAGISSAEALLEAARDAGDGPLDRLALLLPAGPQDRIVVRHGEPPALQTAGSEPALPGDVILVALDLDGRAPAEALERGERARAGLGAALLRLGAARLRTARGDDLAGLVPEYVTLPRGVAAVSSTPEVAWSRR